MLITRFTEGFSKSTPLAFRAESVVRCIEHPNHPDKMTDVQFLGHKEAYVIRASLPELRETLAAHGVRLVKLPSRETQTLGTLPSWHVNPAAVALVETDALQTPGDVRRRLRFTDGTALETSAPMETVLELLASTGA